MAKGDELEKLRILIVDDQQEMRSMIKGMLMEMGITQTFEASDGKEALSFSDAALDMVDVVICDWNMPKLSGVEFLRQMRSVSPEMPFLMITGRSDIDFVAEAKARALRLTFGNLSLRRNWKPSCGLSKRSMLRNK